MVCELDVAADQRDFVAPNAVSIAEAHFTPGHWMRAIYADGQPVGFVLTFDDPSEGHFLWRFMIAEEHQRRGIGRRAMQQVLEHWRELGATAARTSVVPSNTGATRLYEALGFRSTGEEEHGGAVMTLDMIRTWCADRSIIAVSEAARARTRSCSRSVEGIQLGLIVLVEDRRAWCARCRRRRRSPILPRREGRSRRRRSRGRAQVDAEHLGLVFLGRLSDGMTPAQPRRLGRRAYGARRTTTVHRGILGLRDQPAGRRGSRPRAPRRDLGAEHAVELHHDVRPLTVVGPDDCDAVVVWRSRPRPRRDAAAA